MSIQEAGKIHFIGIGGIGMSALARLCLHEKKTVSGSDSNESAITEALKQEGVAVTYEQGAGNMTDDIDLVVYTEAIAKDNQELVAARAKNIPAINYFEALGQVANEYYLIAVSGAHGKSTTTAMLVDIFEEAGLDPSAVVGSLRSKTGSNFRAGKSKYMIVEACEYRRDFLSLKPDVLVITNIEHEHVDYYKDLPAVQKAFREFAETIPETGALICNLTDPNLAPVIKGLNCQVIDYRPQIDLSIALRQPGLHNRQNAAAAKAVARFEKIDKTVIDQALENYAGIWRRFEYKGNLNGAPVYDDYAHHPTEIKAAIAGARELYPKSKLTVVFQSHTYSRTKELFADFITALAKADKVLMLPIYAARETNTYGVNGEQLVDKLKAGGTDTTYFETHEAAVLALKESVGTDDVVMVIGAGDVTKVASMLTM